MLFGSGVGSMAKKLIGLYAVIGIVVAITAIIADLNHLYLSAEMKDNWRALGQSSPPLHLVAFSVIFAVLKGLVWPYALIINLLNGVSLPEWLLGSLYK
jgi:H+/Cl- antiporter ClcA